MRALWLAGVALMMASGAQAADPDELGCMEQNYTPEQTAQIDGLLPQVDMMAAADNSAMNAMGMLVGGAASSCAATYTWDQTQFQAAIFFELGRLMEQAIRRHGPLAQEDIAKIDEALAKGDRTALWTALEQQVMQGMEGQPDSVSPGNAMLFGTFMLEVGLGLEQEKAEKVGAFLATRAMQRSSRRAFAGQQEEP